MTWTSRMGDPEFRWRYISRGYRAPAAVLARTPSNSDVVTRRATAPEGPPDVSECSGRNQ